VIIAIASSSHSLNNGLQHTGFWSGPTHPNSSALRSGCRAVARAPSYPRRQLRCRTP
jgi:hypothetical protein